MCNAVIHIKEYRTEPWYYWAFHVIIKALSQINNTMSNILVSNICYPLINWACFQIISFSSVMLKVAVLVLCIWTNFTCWKVLQWGCWLHPRGSSCHRGFLQLYLDTCASVCSILCMHRSSPRCATNLPMPKREMCDQGHLSSRCKHWVTIDSP